LPIVGDERVLLNGTWQFRLDPENLGVAQKWQLPQTPGAGWSEVTVPHTWQVTAESAEYYGAAWYRRRFVASPAWKTGAVRVEFEAVFHSAIVWVNGRQVGQHLGKGYTAFALDLTPDLAYGQPTEIVVRVDNAFSDAMLPRGKSSDWAHDGGIYRPVSLIVTPRTFVEHVAVEAIPDLAAGTAEIRVVATVHNSAATPVRGDLGYAIIDDRTGASVLEQRRVSSVTAAAGASVPVTLPAGSLPNAKLWHFDHPHLYTIEVLLEADGVPAHRFATTFGVRSFEAKDAGLYLNGERVFLMGVERMAGSHPDYGMAEPGSWITHDHDDLKELNCVFTRVHWQQDRRVLDYCDRHGILIQLEVPTWGSDTFKEKTPQPLPALMENGLDQLREMIAQNRNHPSVVIWGLCNEIGGQNPPAYAFARRMYEEARKLDSRRLRSYASNSLQQTPERDVAALMDVIEWNEYYETWYGGSAASVGPTVDAIHRAFPGKPIVISEYGYCACTPERPEGDDRRIEILRSHDRAYRERDFVAGLIFFCYNDYRTHVGDKGIGALKQRVHGVVDVYGARKPSFDVLRPESSPVDLLEVAREAGKLAATVRTRKQIPAYTLAGYRLRWIAYDARGVPVEQRDVPLPTMAPGSQATVPLETRSAAPARVRIDVLRPTGFSACTVEWNG
jgi:beta-glucuronidase